MLIFILKGYKIPKTGSSKYVGDCTPMGVAKEAVKVYKMSNAKNPIKTGNIAVDYVAGKNPVIKGWNTGYNLGKMTFVAQETYNNTCKHKK